MNTDLHYKCPQCSNEFDVKIKEMDKLKRESKINCSNCDTPLLLNNEGKKVVDERFDDFKALTPYQLGVSGMILLSSILNFSGVLPLGGLIVGYLIAGGLFLKVKSTEFPKKQLTFENEQSDLS